MLDCLLRERALPPLPERGEMLELLQREEYGYLPQPPDRTTWTVTTHLNNFCAGKATLERVELTVSVRGRSFTFPAYAAIPVRRERVPFFVHINFREDVPDRYMPTEELIDHGFAVLSFCYRDVTADNGDFTDGLAGVFYPDGKREAHDAGKIALWAWAAQRVMDFAQTDERLDCSRAVVCGHSRLGKTALLTAATDERFLFAHSNDSGCSGAALSRGNRGETIRDICERFGYWFCPSYAAYAGKETELPHDQHFLLASIAPRYAHVASAERDAWADPVSEYLACAAASEAYERSGVTGFVSEDRLPSVGDRFHEGHVGYSLRAGTHYFSREDWLSLIAFVKRHEA